MEGPDYAVSNDHNAMYWVSIHYNKETGKESDPRIEFRYGKGEARVEFAVYSCEIGKQKDNVKAILKKLIPNIKYYHVIGLTSVGELEEPVYRVYPPVILGMDEITMDIAAQNKAIHIQSLNPACQYLYGLIAGKKFVLNSEEDLKNGFNFEEAIQASWEDENGWCRTKIAEKVKNQKEKNEAYLRITMGNNDSNSPGINFVMEIWPPEHFSPVHKHSNANAIIKVLYGSVTAHFYRWLSPEESKNYAFKRLVETGEVTYITPQINQIHMLKNYDEKYVCVTIQCYRFSEDDHEKRECFDFIDLENDNHPRIEFFPNSDMDFVEFKEKMREEAKNRPEKKSPIEENAKLVKGLQKKVFMSAPEASEGSKSNLVYGKNGWDVSPKIVALKKITEIKKL